MEGRDTCRSPKGRDLMQRNTSHPWWICLGRGSSVPAACSRGKASGSTSPRLSGLQVPDGWLGLLTPAHGSRCLVLLPITSSSRATRAIVIQTPRYNSQVWYPSALEPGLGWAAWLPSPGLFVWENVSLSGIRSLFICGRILITKCYGRDLCLFLCRCVAVSVFIWLEQKERLKLVTHKKCIKNPVKAIVQHFGKYT